MAKTVHSVFKDVSNAVNNDSGTVGKLFDEIEKRSGRGRKEAAGILVSVLVTALIFVPSLTELLCNLICFVYPAMKTLAEMESNKKSKCNCHGAATLCEKFFQSCYSEFVSGCTTGVEMTAE
ncbi:hypothetical protein T01_12845 [Trichinella spiralis]|uniref:Uncharacterized protein n=1 Tax=Trichinella spiralis TaxID=6334 RepID=A0A0V1C0Q5_TRISP|nr:hypothetical protein T01_12845 [Trichinella spiralis]